MKLEELLSGILGINLAGVHLALRGGGDFRAYLSECVRRYDEYAGHGLAPADPIAWLCKNGGAIIGPDDRVQLPPRLFDGGGTSLEELLILAACTRVLQPKKVFEIGTFNGRTTTAFIVNAPADAKIISLDLPPEGLAGRQMIETDVNLVKERKLASYVHEFKLGHRLEQILCDSTKFDPEPHRDSVELGFIDGAHALEFVRNDTEKMAIMMAARGLVFWHDYGGKGGFRPLSDYLEELSRRIPLFRVPGTTLAWTSAADLQKLR